MPRRARGVPATVLAGVGLLALAGSVNRRPRPVTQPHVVEIRGMEFHPRELEVKRGDTVVWINRDLVPHTATSTGKAGWDTDTLLQGKSGLYVPRHAGEEPYTCRLHPVMLGKLIVR